MLVRISQSIGRVGANPFPRSVMSNNYNGCMVTSARFVYGSQRIIPSTSSIRLITERFLNTNTATPAKMAKKRIFDESLKFPTEFMMKIVGVNEPYLATDIEQTLTTCLGSQHSDIRGVLKETANGKYVSVTIKRLFQSAAELYRAYEVVGKDPRVKIVL